MVIFYPFLQYVANSGRKCKYYTIRGRIRFRRNGKRRRNPEKRDIQGSKSMGTPGRFRPATTPSYVEMIYEYMNLI